MRVNPNQPHSIVFKINGLVKSYGGREVLSVDHLEIKAGEILGIMGPSGAGKSTLLRLLNFLEAPTRGVIWFEGMTVNGDSVPPLEQRRKVTMVFQRPILLSGTVRGNVSYGLKLRGIERTDRRLEEMLHWVGLGHLADAPASTLSGGERQRVALARALIIHPEVLLLDEPTANLDPYNVGLIEEIVTGTKNELRRATILVTHNVFQARRLSDRVAFILNGRIVEVGETQQVFQEPRDPRTAAFVRGEMVW